MAAKVYKKDLLERYDATGDEGAYLEALPLYELAIEDGADAPTLVEYGYLLEIHARRLLRKAVEQYELAAELDPSSDKALYQVIGARAGLRETELPIAVHERRLAASPADVREYRLLASAYLAGHDYNRAAEVIERGLAIAPDDSILIGSRAEVRAGNGDDEGALADWRQALELDPDHIGPLFMSAFFLERIGRRQEAIDAWQAIIGWSEARGNELDTIWPKQELTRLQQNE
jgi:tetratricopeptide (TPR) repeat protein